MKYIDLQETKDSLDWIKGIIRKEYIDMLLVQYNTAKGEEKEKLWQEIQTLLEMRKNLQLFSEHPLTRAPTRAKATEGIFTIGTVINANRALYPYMMKESDLFNHTLIVSAPNHGKSTLISSIAMELIQHDVSWVIVDPKNDFAGLLRINSEIAVVDVHKDLRFNIFEAPRGVEPAVWRNHVMDAMASVFSFYHGTKSYLARAVQLVVDERGDRDFHAGHVYELVKSWSESTRTNADYRDVLLSRLELMNQYRDVFWCTKSLDFENIKWLIIRTHKVSIEINALLFELLLLREYIYRVTSNIKDDAAKLKVFCSDESSKGSLGKHRERDWSSTELGPAPVTKILAQARQFKISVIASDQMYSALSDALKSVSSTKIIGRLNNGRDVTSVTDDLMLEEDEAKSILKLNQGEWIVRTARIPKPFMIRTQDFKIPRISEEEIEQHMASRRYWLKTEEIKEQIKKSVTSAVSQEEWLLLVSILEHPFTQLSNRLKQQMSDRRMQVVKHSLIQKGLVSESVVKIGVGRPRMLLELSDEAIKLLNSVGHDTAFWRHIKHEGLTHVMFKYIISERLKEIGFEAVREKHLAVEGGYRVVDVYFEDKGKKVGIEIECSTSDIENKVRALEKLDMVLLAYMTEDTLQRVSNWLAEHKELNGKVRLMLISDYLKELSIIRRERAGENSEQRGKFDSAFKGNKPGIKGEQDD